MQDKQDVDNAKETLAEHQKMLDDLNAEFKSETDQLAAKIDPATEELQKISIRPAKKDIIVKLVGLAWLPFWQSSDGKTTPAWQ